MIKIGFNNDNNYRFEFDEKRLSKRISKAVFDLENLHANFSFDISLVSKERIRSINKKTRGINKITDVLSFPFIDGNGLTITDFDTKTIFLGDVVICYDKIISQAKLYNHSVKREYSFLLTHSLLHLLGYDHISKKQEKIMFDKQDTVLENLGIYR